MRGVVVASAEIIRGTTHRSMTPAGRQSAGISDGLVRGSAGIEDIEDLQEDLARAVAME